MSGSPDLAGYCRQVEAYLCRRNGGHLIRIVGPAFEQVCGWAASGIPLAVVLRGIDQYCERNQAKATRRRPVRIEFCEADILQLFDDWRRAVGVAVQGEMSPEPARKGGLASHLERASARLAALRGGGARSQPFIEQIDQVVRELDRLRGEAQHARGEKRLSIVSRLDDLDERLSALAEAEVPAENAAALRRDAAAEIEPFAARMPPAAREAATRAAFVRLVRESLGMPTLRF